ncbi:7836_t:CDS:2 [Diversispora eburnea]|uniref:7836_t:CDS:1 n=1 Tax=Diversispora eburnea TaxID=1213867 RepID=A0A9N9CPJ2_9GLOM|nr:7836_t:CDS:2 [Diversispora eburnea]
MPEIDELEMNEQGESESENEIDDTATLINDFSNPEAQQLGSPPPPITVTEVVEALEKVISYQESLEVEKGFDENGLKMLRKRFKEWYYEREKNKKQSSLISFFSRINESDISITL